MPKFYFLENTELIENSQGRHSSVQFLQRDSKFSNLNDDFEKKSNQNLLQYAQYLQSLDLPENFKINTENLIRDINNGLFFDSNIPQGYGIGSSGALVAAIFEKYSITKKSSETISKEDLKELKKYFRYLRKLFSWQKLGD